MKNVNAKYIYAVLLFSVAISCSASSDSLPKVSVSFAPSLNVERGMSKGTIQIKSTAKTAARVNFWNGIDLAVYDAFGMPIDWSVSGSEGMPIPPPVDAFPMLLDESAKTVIWLEQHLSPITSNLMLIFRTEYGSFWQLENAPAESLTLVATYRGGSQFFENNKTFKKWIEDAISGDKISSILEGPMSSSPVPIVFKKLFPLEEQLRSFAEEDPHEVSQVEAYLTEPARLAPLLLSIWNLAKDEDENISTWGIRALEELSAGTISLAEHLPDSSHRAEVELDRFLVNKHRNMKNSTMRAVLEGCLRYRNSLEVKEYRDLHQILLKDTLENATPAPISLEI